MKQKIILSLALILSLAGCRTLQDLNIENPRYSFRDIRPRVSLALPLSASTIDFDMNVEVDNPNSIGLRLDRIDFDLMVNGDRVVSGVSRDRIRVPANGVGEVPLRARVGYNELRSLWNEVTDSIRGRRANYELRGTAYYNTPIGQMKFPVTVFSSR